MKYLTKKLKLRNTEIDLEVGERSGVKRGLDPCLGDTDTRPNKGMRIEIAPIEIQSHEGRMKKEGRSYGLSPCLPAFWLDQLTIEGELVVKPQVGDAS
jgi:hypothetical protein